MTTKVKGPQGPKYSVKVDEHLDRLLDTQLMDEKSRGAGAVCEILTRLDLANLELITSTDEDGVKTHHHIYFSTEALRELMEDNL